MILNHYFLRSIKNKYQNILKKYNLLQFTTIFSENYVFMKKHIFTFTLLLFLAAQYVSAKPVFAQTPYLIGCLINGGIGTVGIGGLGTNGVTYPLAFYSDRDGDSAEPTDYWNIKEVAPGQYSIQNAQTLQYVKYDNTVTEERRALVLVDNLQADLSTLFTMHLMKSGNLCYYEVMSVTTPLKGWRKSTGVYGGINPVGVQTVIGDTDECFIFYTSSGNAVVDDNQTAIVLPTKTQNLGSFATALTTLTFSYKVPVVNTLKKELYLTIPENQMGTNVPMTVTYTGVNAAYKVYIDAVLVNNGNDFTFNNVVAGKTYKIEVRNGTTIISTGTIVFSSLPLVQIYSDVSIQYVYSLGRIVVTEPEDALPSEINLSDLRYRGATAAGQPKKAYAIKLKNPMDGATPYYRPFLGLRSDNNWILDAMYIDPARMRNRVSTDLWNDFSAAPYFKVTEPNMINGTRGKFVEVFLNDSYNGIYCMTEKVDRKQLNVKKLQIDPTTGAVTQRGAIYKSSAWSVAVLLGNPYWGSPTGTGGLYPYSNNSETWDSWEVKYPDFGDGEPINWKPLSDAVQISAPAPTYTNNGTFTAKVADYYDMPVFIDYYLFIELLLATDNHGKNTYLSVYDQSVSPKMTITPWDLDGTWGRRWDGSSSLTRANQSFPSFINSYEHMENNLYIRLRQLNTDGYSDKLKNRYKELRSTYFTYDKIMERFQMYRAKFKVSGADTRERAKWAVGDFDVEMTFLSNWITNRLLFLDMQYLGAPYVTGTNDSHFAKLSVYPTTVRDNFTISNIEIGQKVQVVSLQGIQMMQTVSTQPLMDINISNYAPGIYIVRAGAASTKIIKL